jgi:protein-S-isoprenylcysteine O-methyltransferase Ste14
MPIAFEIGIWNAWIFMSVFILQMLVMVFAGRWILKRSHVPEIARQSKLEKWAGIMGNVFWLLALAYSVFLPIHLGTTWFLVGLVVFLVGLVMMAIATFNFIATPADQVIAQGVYRLSRHPMYFATLLIYLACSLAAASWLFLLIAILSALCFRLEALIEERHCLTVYGDAYQGYMNRTPRWMGIPKR